MATVQELINFLSKYNANDLVEFTTNGSNVFCYGTMTDSKLSNYIKDCDTYKYAKFHNSLQGKDYKAKNIVTIYLSEFKD